MARILPQQIRQADYGDANRLLAAGQQQVQQGLGGLQGALSGYRDAVVGNNTAGVLNLLTGAQNVNDYQQRQQQAQQLIAAAGGDIDTAAVQKAQLTMPDTLLARQGVQNQLKDYDTQQHDTPLLNQIMQMQLSGDTAGAANLLSQVQGNAAPAIKFGADRQDQRFTQGIQQQQLGIQQAGLALRKQAAADRANAIASGAKQSNALLKALTTENANATNADTSAAVKFRNDNLKAQEQANPLNNPKNDLDTAANQINSDTNLIWPLNRDRGTKLQSFVNKLDPDNKLTANQRVNLLQVMNNAFESADGFFTSGDKPDAAALKAGTSAIKDLQSTQTNQLKNTRDQIQSKKLTNLQKAQILAQFGGGGLSNDAILRLYQNDEE